MNLKSSAVMNTPLPSTGRGNEQTDSWLLANDHTAAQAVARVARLAAGWSNWTCRLPGHSRPPRLVAWVARSQQGFTIFCLGCQVTAGQHDHLSRLPDEHADSEATEEAYARIKKSNKSTGAVCVGPQLRKNGG